VRPLGEKGERRGNFYAYSGANQIDCPGRDVHYLRIGLMIRKGLIIDNSKLVSKSLRV